MGQSNVKVLPDSILLDEKISLWKVKLSLTEAELLKLYKASLENAPLYFYPLNFTFYHPSRLAILRTPMVW